MVDGLGSHPPVTRSLLKRIDGEEEEEEEWMLCEQRVAFYAASIYRSIDSP